MSDVETWGIVLRDRASGAEQWVACEVRDIGDGRWRAMSVSGLTLSRTPELAVARRGESIAQHGRSLAFVRIETPAEYAAHMEGVCLTLAIDEANDLRAEVTRLSDTIGAIGRRVCAESCERDVILDAIGDACDAARRVGEVSMRHAAAKVCERAGEPGLASEIRALSLTGSPPAQSHKAPAPPSAPLTVADATARARSAAAPRVVSEAAHVAAPDADAWVETWTDAGPRGLRVIRAALATAAPERWQAERLCAAAGISRERVDLDGSPGTMWFNVIEEAVKSGRVSSLVAAARAKYPQCGL